MSKFQTVPHRLSLQWLLGLVLFEGWLFGGSFGTSLLGPKENRNLEEFAYSRKLNSAQSICQAVRKHVICLQIFGVPLSINSIWRDARIFDASVRVSPCCLWCMPVHVESNCHVTAQPQPLSQHGISPMTNAIFFALLDNLSRTNLFRLAIDFYWSGLARPVSVGSGQNQILWPIVELCWLLLSWVQISGHALVCCKYWQTRSTTRMKVV